MPSKQATSSKLHSQRATSAFLSSQMTSGSKTKESSYYRVEI